MNTITPITPKIYGILRWYTKTTPSDHGLRVAELIDEWLGLHHIDQKALAKVEWDNPRWCVLKLSKFSYLGTPSTFDGSSLTALIFLAHDHCIRVAISPCNSQFLEFTFHGRDGRDGDFARRHPTIEQALRTWRECGHAAREVQP